MHFLILALSFCVHATMPKPINVILRDTEGKQAGTATLTPLINGVKILIDVKGLTPGEHAFHFHEKGICQGPKFESAGGHFSPAESKHGFDQVGGPHAGDMPNILVGNDGRARVEVINTSVTLGRGKSSLLQAGGTAIVIHEKHDDYKSQPAGNAGGRVVCGEIRGT